MRQVSVGLYAVIIACFFLPWFQVGCGALQVEVTGFQLAKAQYEGNPTSVEDFRAFEQVVKALSGENKKAQWWLFGILFASVAGIISQLIGPLPGIHFLHLWSAFRFPWASMWGLSSNGTEMYAKGVDRYLPANASRTRSGRARLCPSSTALDRSGRRRRAGVTP